MLLLVSLLKLLNEIALLSMLGQGLLALLAGERRSGNPVYRLLQVVTEPVFRLVRLISPQVVLDRHIPLAAFSLGMSLWLALTLFKISLCLQEGALSCR